MEGHSAAVIKVVVVSWIQLFWRAVEEKFVLVVEIISKKFLNTFL